MDYGDARVNQPTAALVFGADATRRTNHAHRCVRVVEHVEILTKVVAM